jgi:hypothetical protein
MNWSDCMIGDLYWNKHVCTVVEIVTKIEEDSRKLLEYRTIGIDRRDGDIPSGNFVEKHSQVEHRWDWKFFLLHHIRYNLTEK